PTDHSDIQTLLAIMARLRDPQGGCPWDVQQDFATIAPYTIEEAYEVADAILREDWDALPGELGDLLLQVVYHARMGEERGWFDFDRVADGIAAKMVERHPHVFGAEEVEGSRALRTVWEDRKARERAARAERRGGDASLLADVPLGLPALTRAVKLQKRAARAGFDWTGAKPVLAKLREELAELEAALAGGAALAERELELGDLLFTVANLARHLELDPEAALRVTNAKFERRFRRIEAAAAAQGRPVGALTSDELEALWERAKAEERETARGHAAPG
ncbi:MAG TPA: nucleoside triphosphate pyrophosphohydrolase, partial [Geminicoccaceae bacterium]|nr:nucleoside triphosphate pyrophosphohydrolase [Geminicoccaceae bacterium]